MIEKIRKIYFYGGDSENGKQSSIEAKQWMNDNKIPYTNLWYYDVNQHSSVFNALNTWTFGSSVTISEFPFVIYDEIHDTGDVITQCIYGLDNIINSNLKELVELG